jgi:hypothetical protein
LLGDALEVLEKTIDTKKSDLGMSVLVDSKKMTFVGGCAIAEGNKLDSALKQLIAEVKKNDEAAGSVKFGDETVDGIHVYSLTMPTPDEQVRPFFGDKIELAVGVANDKVVAAGGRDAIKTLKSAIANLKKTGVKEVPPFQLTLAAASLAKFTGEVAEDPQTKSTAVMLGSLLEKAGKQGHITVTAQSVPQGIRMRLELEEGLLKAIGSLSQMMGGMAPSN